MLLLRGYNALIRLMQCQAADIKQAKRFLVGMETGAIMNKLTGVVLHHDAEIVELRSDREPAVDYLKAAMESLDNPDDRATGLLALRRVAEA